VENKTLLSVVATAYCVSGGLNNVVYVNGGQK